MWRAGQYYLGDWKRDMMEGVGTYGWPDGRRCVGEFRNDCMNGDGLYEYGDGSYYRGQFRNDLFHGKGVFHTDHGVDHEVEWNDQDPLLAMFALPTGPPPASPVRAAASRHRSEAPDAEHSGLTSDSFDSQWVIVTHEEARAAASDPLLTRQLSTSTAGSRQRLAEQPSSEEQRKAKQTPCRQSEELVALPRQESITADEAKCVICLSSTSTHVVVPCGHMCLCEQCAVLPKLQQTKQCPVCRSKYSMIIRVFKS